MSDTDSTAQVLPLPIDPVQKAEARAKRQVAAAASTGTITRSRSKVGPAKPKTDAVAKVKAGRQAAKPGHKVTSVKTNTSGSITKTGKVTKATAGRSIRPTAKDVKAATDSPEVKAARQELIEQGRKLVAEGDVKQWELAELTFKATEETSVGRMKKQDWAKAIGVSPGVVSRFISVWREYGSKNSRQVRKDTKLPYSFNDHVEMLKVSDPAELAQIKKAAEAAKVSFQSKLKEMRETTTASTNGKAGDKVLDRIAHLQASATSDGDSRLADFEQLTIFAMKSVIAVREAVLHLPEGDWDDKRAQMVRNLMIEFTEVTNAFEKVSLDS